MWQKCMLYLSPFYQVTPAHSATDLEIGRRSGLAPVQAVIDKKGNIHLPGTQFHVN